MFDFFKKNKRKIEDWELTFFRTLFGDLRGRFADFEKQLPFIKNVRLNMSDIPNLVSFVYLPGFYKDFENPKSNNYKLEGITVDDVKTKSTISLTLYFAHQIFLGYSTDAKEGTFVFDSNSFNIKKIRKIPWGEQDSSRIKKLLTKEELKYVNITDVYVSVLDGEEYFHIKEGDDGDFVGMNNAGKVFYVTHDPFEIKELPRETLTEVLKC